MKKITLLVMTVFISMLLTACYTLDTLKKFPVNETKETFNVMQEDQVAGFAKVVQNNQPTKFMVIGQNHAYLIEGESDRINDLLSMRSSNIKLEILTNSSDGLKLEVQPEQKETNHFKATLGFKVTVDQPTPQQKEVLKAKSSSLNVSLVEKEHESYLTIYIPIQGKIVLLNDEMKAIKLENMSKGYPVKIGYYSTKKSMSPGNLLFNVLMMPFSLAADATLIAVGAIVIIGGAGR